MTIKIKDKERFKIHKIQENKFGSIYYRTKNAKGNSVFGEGKVTFLDEKYKQKHPAYEYNFEKFMVVKPIDSDFKSANEIKDNNGPVIEDDDSYIFGTNIDVSKKNNSSENTNEKVETPKLITEFNFDDTSDFDIVIDTKLPH